MKAALIHRTENFIGWKNIEIVHYPFYWTAKLLVTAHKEKNSDCFGTSACHICSQNFIYPFLTLLCRLVFFSRNILCRANLYDSSPRSSGISPCARSEVMKSPSSWVRSATISTNSVSWGKKNVSPSLHSIISPSSQISRTSILIMIYFSSS